MKMDVSLSPGKKAILAAALVVIALLALLAWSAGEAHYRNCITAAELRHPVIETELEARSEAIAGCSRLP